MSITFWYNLGFCLNILHLSSLEFGLILLSFVFALFCFTLFI